MSQQHIHRINEAVKACLRACCVSPSPLATLAQFVETLRHDPLWNEADIELVASNVRRMLKMIHNPPPVSAAAGN